MHLSNKLIQIDEEQINEYLLKYNEKYQFK